jgi:membrane associated rhomboid family serine protease
MIPLRDLNPTRSFPYVTLLIIAANVAVFAIELAQGATGGPDALENFIMTFALRPFEILNGVDLPPATPVPVQATLLTAMFMHSGWLHLLGNMWYLGIFGNNIEERFGHAAYLVLYLAWGLAAAAAQIAVDPASQIPMLGASGAVAGVLGAYLVLFPMARIDVLVVLGIFLSRVRMSALFVIGFWIVLQLLNGVMSFGDFGEGGVAYFAHIGGAVAGLAVGIVARFTNIGNRPPALGPDW